MLRSIIIVLALGIISTVTAQEWSPVGKGIQSQFPGEHNNIYALAIYNDELYAAGSFTEAGEKAASYIARWNGSSWLPVGEGMDAMVNSLCVYKGALYAGGWFTMAGGVKANRIAKWDGVKWEPLGKGLNFHPNDLVIYKNDLYAGGEFTLADGAPAKNIAKWDGTRWSAIGNSVDVISKMAVYEDKLYTTGWAMVKGSKGINQWDGTKLTKAGFEVTGVPNSLIVYKNILYLGGYFPHDAKTKENCLSQYDGSKLQITGAKGTNGHVYSMLIYNEELYVAGFFTEVEGKPANNMAKWNGDSWSAFTPGVDFHPHAMIIYKGHLYAAGGYSSSESGTVGRVMIAQMPINSLPEKK